MIPCYIEGSPDDGTPWGCLFMPAKVRLVVGEVLESLTKRFLKEIATLANHADFEPGLAGRFYKPEE